MADGPGVLANFAVVLPLRFGNVETVKTVCII